VPNVFQDMNHYQLTAFHQVATGGLECSIAGPGIPTTGIHYWFRTEQEAQTFVENLNSSYIEAKRLASWRKSIQKRIAKGTPSLMQT
jgi:hypothetical protein